MAVAETAGGDLAVADFIADTAAHVMTNRRRRIARPPNDGREMIKALQQVMLEPNRAHQLQKYVTKSIA